MLGAVQGTFLTLTFSGCVEEVLLSFLGRARLLQGVLVLSFTCLPSPVVFILLVLLLA